MSHRTYDVISEHQHLKLLTTFFQIGPEAAVKSECGYSLRKTYKYVMQYIFGGLYISQQTEGQGQEVILIIFIYQAHTITFAVFGHLN